MGCLVALVGLALPRFALFLIWVFSDRLSYAFDSFVVGFLGFILLPYTTLFWALAYAPIGGVSGFGYILVAFGVVLDISNWAGGGSAAKRRRQGGGRVA